MTDTTATTSSSSGPTFDRPKVTAFTLWFLLGLVFLALLLDYAPKVGGLLAVLIVLYLVLKVVPKFNTLVQG